MQTAFVTAPAFDLSNDAYWQKPTEFTANVGGALVTYTTMLEQRGNSVITDSDNRRYVPYGPNFEAFGAHPYIVVGQDGVTGVLQEIKSDLDEN